MSLKSWNVISKFLQFNLENLKFVGLLWDRNKNLKNFFSIQGCFYNHEVTQFTCTSHEKFLFFNKSNCEKLPKAYEFSKAVLLDELHEEASK